MVDLTQEQRRVVEYIKGPMMVKAGPGSGKTRVITEKVARLIESGIPQEQILCMTFTDKATEEMSSRLGEKGYSDVRISTFHAFARELLDEMQGAEDIRAVEIFERPLQILWCLKSIDKFGLDMNLLGNSRYADLFRNILDGLSMLKKEMITPSALQDFLDRQARLHGDDVPEEIKKMGELNKVYRKYEEYKKQRGVMDYDDMVAGAVGLLEDRSEVLKKYRTRFRHVLVDEFQDNNYAQFKLVCLLADHGNITVVGDEDQSIMGFQGAHSEVFENFMAQYPGCKKEHLARNFRSTGRITEFANQILRSSAEFVPGVAQNEEGDLIEVIRTSSEDAQAAYIARTIQKLVGTQVRRRGKGSSALRYSDIGILMRRNSASYELVRKLRRAGIPTVLSGTAYMLSDPNIKDLMSYMRVVCTPDASGQHAARILHRNGISDYNIRLFNRIAEKRAARNDCILDSMKQLCLEAKTQKTEIRSLERVLQRIKTGTKNLATSHAVYNVIAATGICSQLIERNDEDARYSIRLLDQVCKHAEIHEEMFPEQGMSDFLRYVQILDGEIKIEDDSMDAVNVMTVHKSKGKEFPIVFIPDMSERKFPLQYREKPFQVPSELLSGRSAEPNSKEAYYAEEQRLFYVSATRAMNKIYITSPMRYADNTTQKRPSEFLVDLDYEENPLIAASSFESAMPEEVIRADRKAKVQEQAVRAIMQMNLSTAVRRIAELEGIRHAEGDSSEGFDPAWVRRVDLDGIRAAEPEKTVLFGKDQTLSATAIRAYNDCPLKYKMRLMKVPYKSRKESDLGSIVHDMIDAMDKRGRPYTVDEAMETFRSKMDRHMYDTTTAKKMEDDARGIFETYLEWVGNRHNEVIGTEVKIDLVVKGVRFNGSIDRLEKTPDGEYEVIDFKTGSNPLSRPMAAKDIQLNLYAEAVRLKYGKLPRKVTLFYLKKNKEVEYSATKESMLPVLDEVKDAVGRIQSQEFEATPSAKVCRSCDYHDICDQHHGK